MDRSKLASLGERLKTGSSQMGRLVSEKVKDFLQAPTPESKMVDESTLETMEEPNWGLNLRICAMINSEEFSGSEIVRAIKKKIVSKSDVSQRLSLELLETCVMNCDKVFSEVASEKVLEEMVKMIEYPQTNNGNRDMALQLIRAWGESEDLAYLPVFRQTYMSLKQRSVSAPVQDGDSSPIPYSLESYVHDHQPLSPPERYPIPNTGFDNSEQSYVPYNFGSLSIEETKEVLLVARNSSELLSSILNSETDPKAIQNDLTMSMLDKCKESQPVIQRIIQTTTDDEVTLFDALNLHEELQKVISRYEEMESAVKPDEQLPESSVTTEPSLPNLLGTHNEANLFTDSPKKESAESSSDKKSIDHGK